MLAALAPVLRAIAGDLKGTIAVAAEDVASGERLAIGARRPMPLASVTKVPLMVTLYRMAERGTVDLHARVRVARADRALGTGLLAVLDPNAALTVRDLIVLAIDVSDNTATDLLYRLAPPRAITREMRKLGLSVSVTQPIDTLLRVYLQAAAPAMAALPHDAARTYERTHPIVWNALAPAAELRVSKAIFAGGADCAPAGDITRLLCMLVRGELANAAHSKDMLAILYAQQHRGRLPGALPDHVKMACKPGTFPGKVVNDAGIVERGARRVAVAVFAWYRRDLQTIAQVARAAGRIARAIYDAL